MEKFTLNPIEIAAGILSGHEIRGASYNQAHFRAERRAKRTNYLNPELY